MNARKIRFNLPVLTFPHQHKKEKKPLTAPSSMAVFLSQFRHLCFVYFRVFLEVLSCDIILCHYTLIHCIWSVVYNDCGLSWDSSYIFRFCKRPLLTADQGWVGVDLDWLQSPVTKYFLIILLLIL